MSITARPRTVIVCLPNAGKQDSFTASMGLTDHVEGPTQLAAQFPVAHRRLLGWFTRFTSRHLLGARRRRGVVAYAAGGRIGRLNLHGAGRQAWLQATGRWTVWQQVTAGLAQASPWENYLHRHQAAPEKLSLEQARRMFLRQPAIAAMLAHNAVPTSSVELDPYEVDAYRAGQRAYATRYMLAAVAGDCMLTADGQWLQPASDAFTDVLAYLKTATAHLHRLPRRHAVVAVTT